MFLENYYFNKDIEICSNNSWHVEYDEQYYDEKRLDLFLEATRKV